MKKLLTLILLISFQLGLIAQVSNVMKVEPPFWWTGMSNPKLQLLIYGNEISLAEVMINHPGIEVNNVQKVENPNYIFIDIMISEDIEPGFFRYWL